MQALVERGCGLDVHQATVVACLLIVLKNGKVQMGIPAKSISDSEMKPINDSGAKPIMIGAKRRWRDDSGRSDRHPSTEIRM